VVTCGSKIGAISSPHNSTALQRLKDAGTIRLGSLQMAEFAYGPTGHNSHYGPVHNPWAVDPSLAARRGMGSAVAARLTLRRWDRYLRFDPDARAFLRRDRMKTTYGRISRAGAMAIVAVARHRRAAGRTVEDCALLLA